MNGANEQTIPVKKDLSEVHMVRAAASVAVCFFHLYLGNRNLFQPGTFKTFFSFGYLGVELFFVLSGFIICYSLPVWYSSKNYKTFFFKRILRIEPPYLVSLALILVLNTISHYITRIPNSIDWLNILFHIAYLNNFGLGPYINIVAWTLGVEFQFYLIIGLIFPFIKNKRHFFIIIAIFMALSSIVILPRMQLIFPFLSLFSLGLALYFYKIRKFIGPQMYAALTIGILIHIYFFFDLRIALACLLCILILLFWKIRNRVIRFLSAISFSLYLTHPVIGGKVINLGLRFAKTDLQRWAVFLVAALASFSFAYIFYLIIEKPAMRWSKKMIYRVE